MHFVFFSSFCFTIAMKFCVQNSVHIVFNQYKNGGDFDKYADQRVSPFPDEQPICIEFQPTTWLLNDKNRRSLFCACMIEIRRKKRRKISIVFTKYSLEWSKKKLNACQQQMPRILSSLNEEHDTCRRYYEWNWIKIITILPFKSHSLGWCSWWWWWCYYYCSSS